MDVAVPRSVVDRPSADRLLMTSKDLADRNCSRDTKKVLGYEVVRRIAYQQAPVSGAREATERGIVDWLYEKGLLPVVVSS